MSQAPPFRLGQVAAVTQHGHFFSAEQTSAEFFPGVADSTPIKAAAVPSREDQQRPGLPGTPEVVAA